MIERNKALSVLGLFVFFAALMATSQASVIWENISSPVPLCNLSLCTPDGCELKDCRIANISLNNCTIENARLVNCTLRNSTEQNTMTTSPRFTYSRDGRNFTPDYYDESLKDALKWIKDNTSQDAVFLSWWDYGHMIRAFGERDVVVYAPSPNLNDTIGAPWTPEKGPFSAEETTRDVARALLSNNSSETLDIMKSYNATYVFVYASDPMKSYGMFVAIGESDKSIRDVEDTFINKALREEEIEGMELAYSDENVVIYRRI